MPSDLSRESLERELSQGWGRPFKLFSSIPSTNSEASSWARAGAPEGALVAADHQSAGRGRWGRSWLSEPGRALQFSVVLRPGPQVELSLLTTAVGLACADAVEEVAEVAPRLKWPNDVTVAGRKLAGILVESESTASGVAFAIAGVGVNTDWPRDELPTAISDQATSLRSETAQPVSRARLLAAILARLRARYESLSDAAGRAAVVADAAARSELLGREIVVTLRAGRRFTGRARALADWGGLEVETPEGMEVVETAEVELVRDR